MDTTDNDLNFVNNLADKYKNKTITKKDIYMLLGTGLLLAGVTFYQTVNAITLQVANFKLEKALSEYTKPAQNQSPMNELPAPYNTQIVDFDFSKPLPELNFNYVNIGNKTCNTVNLELPPTINSLWKPCLFKANNSVVFGGSSYILDI